ncbi:unnamed protein product, partial [Nesidiocoris tenuis]
GTPPSLWKTSPYDLLLFDIRTTPGRPTIGRTQSAYYRYHWHVDKGVKSVTSHSTSVQLQLPPSYGMTIATPITSSLSCGRPLLTMEPKPPGGLSKERNPHKVETDKALLTFDSFSYSSDATSAR